MGHRKRKCTSSLSSGHFTHCDIHFCLSLKRSPLSTHGPSKFPWGKDYFWFDTASFCRVPPCCTRCMSDLHSPQTWMLQKKQQLCHAQATKGGMGLCMQLFSWCHHALIQNNNHIWKPCLVHSSTNPEHSPGIMDILLPKSEHCGES